MANPITEQIIQATAERVKPQLKQAFDNAIMAGMKVMHSKESHHMMIKQLDRGGDMADNIGEGVAKLVGILWKDSQGKLPLQVLIPAGVVLSCKAAEFVAEAGMFEITNESMSEVTKEYSSSFLQLLGVTPDKLQGMMKVALDSQGKKQPGAQTPVEQQGGIIAAAQE